MSTVLPDRSVARRVEGEKKREKERGKEKERKRDKARKECVCVRDTERKREIENAHMCCKQVRETRLYIALDRTEREREKEKVNRLHYANAVQLQLTVAKNRCRYRGMLSRTPEGVFTLFFFSFGHSLFFSSLSFSLALHFAQRYACSSIPDYTPTRRWNEMVPRM